ncbi:MAG: OmpH family outer membrane protein [Prolixibacteraceae bacterium]|nr:OmpH family outer membrane protein [Prolixibacteraceae bacterium]MBN2775879.1 OmpH family outer membrane protein [Prolixibacteraceae bacterium]
MKITAVAVLVLLTGFVNAQTPKFGHIDLQALIQVMPERTTMESEFNKFQGELEDLLGTMQTEYQTMIQEFQNLPETTSELVKTAKLQDIQDKDQRIQNFQASAQQQLQQKYAELSGPVVQKAKGAIEEVAKELGLLYVFDFNSQQIGTILYKSNDSKDILPLVKTKLGIQ